MKSAIVQRQTGRLTVERERPVGRPVVQRLDVRMDPVAAERELVLAANDVEVVGDLPALGVEVARVGSARPEREAVAGDRDADIAGH
jgi:hypothetical protein